MSTMHRSLAVAAMAGTAALVVILTPTTAAAASGELEYTCDYWFGESTGSGSATASFDSGIDAGLVVAVGEGVSLDPLTGSITLPDGFTDLVRANDLTSIQGTGSTYLGIAEPPDKLGEAPFASTETAVPETGPLTIEVEGQVGEYVPHQPGTHTLVAGPFLGFYTATDGVGPDAGVTCELVEGADTAIDSFEVTAAATPTASTTPVRPALVQTDFADDEGAPTLPLAIAALLAAAAALVGRALTGARRH